MITAFPAIPWGYLWQRPQQLLTRLAGQGIPVLYCATSASIDAVSAARGIHELAPLVYHVPLSVPEDCDILHTLPAEKTVAALVGQLSSLLQNTDPTQRWYLVQHPGWLPVVKRLQEILPGAIWYDCMDAHGAFTGAPDWIASTENALLAASDLVTCSSAQLAARCATDGITAHLVRNGVATSHFQKAADRKGDDGASCRESPITIGFYGAVEDWVDVPLMAHLASERPQYHFTIIGVTRDADREHFSGLPNCTVLPPQPYDTLPVLLRSFDVCLIPFHLNELTKAVNPVKVYEYLAAGKPVVATALPELVAELRDVLYLADSWHSFMVALDTAVNDLSGATHEAAAAQRMRTAQQHDWSLRVATLCGLLGAHSSISPATSGAVREIAPLFQTVQSNSRIAFDEELERRDSTWRAELTRISAERDQLLEEQDLSWRAERDRICAERDTALAEQDSTWRAEFSRIVTERDDHLSAQDASWRAERDRICAERDTAFNKYDQAWHNEVARIGRERDVLLQEKETSWQQRYQREVLRLQQELVTARESAAAEMRASQEEIAAQLHAEIYSLSSHIQILNGAVRVARTERDAALAGPEWHTRPRTGHLGKGLGRRVVQLMRRTPDR